MPSPPRSDTHRLDYLNMGLMVGSAVIARAVPFGLFLVAYAVLGPLHYLTEIGWLHQRSYFAPRRSWAWLLAVMAFVAFMATLLPETQHWSATAAWAAEPSTQRWFGTLTFWG